MFSQLTPYETLREKLLKKHSFPLNLVKQVITKPLNSLHTYLAMSALRFYLTHIIQYCSLTQQFSSVFELIPRQMHTTQLYQLLTLELWRVTCQNPQLKKGCRIFKILREWLCFYEERLTKTQSNIFINLSHFLKTNTSTYMERMVFIEEVFDDLQSCITFHAFWENEREEVLAKELGQLKQTPTYENIKALVDILLLITPNTEIEGEDIGYLYNPLIKYLNGIDKYNRFVYRSIVFLFSTTHVSKYEKQLSIASLLFIQKAKQTISIEIINLLITKTSKAVQFALAVNYQQLLEVLYNSSRLQLVEKIEQLPQIRELVMRTIPKELACEAETNYQSVAITVPQRQDATFYFEITKPKSIIFLEYHLDGDIGLELSLEGDLWAYSNTPYLSQAKSRSKSIQILANSCGLHSLTFNNKYSWLTPKHISFSLKIYKPHESPNSEFNELVYPEEYTPWNGYNGLRFDDEEGEFLNIWKSAVGNKSDIIIFEDRWFYHGIVSHISKFKIPEMHKKEITKCLIVREEKVEGDGSRGEVFEEEYSRIVSQLKEWNREVKIRECEYEDI